MASEAALRSLRGEGVVEFALHPGGYIRFGDDFILVATPRSPRGPLTLIAPGLHAAPLRPGDRAWIDDALHVGPHTIPLTPTPCPRPKLGAGWRAALDVLPRPSLLDTGDLTRLAGVGEGLTPVGDDILAGYAYIKGTVPFMTSLCSPLGRAYIRCAARGELPEVVARVLESRDEATARRRARRGVAVGIELRRCNALGRRERNVNEIGPNFIARPYRGVSVQDVATLEDDALLSHVRARRVYRRTEFIIATCENQRALVQVEREDEEGILVGVRDARILARPEEIAFVDDESVDTGNASQLARVAGTRRVTIVQGRFQHVNFIVEPSPLRIRVLEVVPPHPPKLLEMAQAVLDFDEDLPPVALDFEAIDMRELAREHPARHYLFPCRCAGLDLDAEVDFLDAGPPHAADWTLVGCERSRQIHEALYGDDPHERVDFCPRLAPQNGAPTLLKCCLRERGIEQAGNRLEVPWGASLEEVREALHRLVAA